MTQFLSLVFFYGSSHHLHLQFIFIFRSYSSSSHLYLWIWIITGSGSSSLDLDHHWIWIITRSRSSLLDHHHGCYLMILLVTGSSIEPALFHDGCRPSLHVVILQHLYLTYSSERHNTHIHLGENTSYHNDGWSLHFHPG